MAKVKKKEALSLEERLEQALVPVDEQPYEVPENWCWVRISSVANVIMGQSPSGDSTTDDDSYVPLIGGAADMGELLPSVSRYTKTPTKLSKSGDLILCIRATLGRPIYSDGEYCLGRGVAAIRSKYLSKEFLRYYYINSEQYLYDNATGTTFAQVTGKVLENMVISLPPLAEQQRIVEQIESLFAKLDEAKEKALLVLDAFSINRSAILHAAFSGELSKRWRKENNISKSTWKEMVVGDIGEVITGSTPNTKNREYYDGDIPFIKPTELNQGRHVCTSGDYLTEAGRDVSRPVRKGSTCVCCIGATISKCGMLQVDAVTNQQINTIVPYDFMCDEYVYYYCSSDLFKNILIENSSATTLPIINKSRMSQLPVNVPLIEEQKFIVNELDILLQKQEDAKILAEEVIGKIDLIKKAILAKAFRGELSTNNPEEESAIELLKSILSQE